MCASPSIWLYWLSGLPLVACGIACWLFGRRSGRDEVQTVMDDFVRDIGDLAVAKRQYERLYGPGG